MDIASKLTLFVCGAWVLPAFITFFIAERVGLRIVRGRCRCSECEKLRANWGRIRWQLFATCVVNLPMVLRCM